MLPVPVEATLLCRSTIPFDMISESVFATTLLRLEDGGYPLFFDAGRSSTSLKISSAMSRPVEAALISSTLVIEAAIVVVTVPPVLVLGEDDDVLP